MTWAKMGPPQSRGWDHRIHCRDREAAVIARDEMRARVGSVFEGRKVRWKVRPCRVCGKFYIDRDSSSNGDRNGQRKRARARKRAEMEMA